MRAFEIVAMVFDSDTSGAGPPAKDVKRQLAWIAASAWGADQAYERVRAWAFTKNTQARES